MDKRILLGSAIIVLAFAFYVVSSSFSPESQKALVGYQCKTFSGVIATISGEAGMLSNLESKKSCAFNAVTPPRFPIYDMEKPCTSEKDCYYVSAKFEAKNIQPDCDEKINRPGFIIIDNNDKVYLCSGLGGA